MAKSKTAAVAPARKPKKQYKLLFMVLPFMVIVLLFNYVPIFGWIYSVFDYIPGVPILECDFMGLDYFKMIMKDANVIRALKNTFIFATVAVFVAVGQWNSWFDNHIYTRGNDSLTTLQYLLYNYLNEAQRLANQIKNTTNAAGMNQLVSNSISPKGIRMTITVLASLPIFMVYPFMQKYFVKGIMVGAVKG